MEYIDHKITLDVHSTVSPVSLTMKRRETGRRLLIHLAEKGYPYHISNECYAVFTARKPDGKVIFNNCTIEDCVISYEVTEQTTAVVGMLYCEIQIYGAGSKLLVSPSFYLIVEDTVYDEEVEIESTDEFSALTDLISKLTSLKGPRIANVELLASKWVGDESPYSQVVTIKDVTEFSQVDLTPSVEQLAIFHDKDLAFVTENDDGVVTVFAIGDKPLNDYTVQVTIKEVSV